MKPTDSAAPASRLRRLVVPALPATIVTVAGLALATGVIVTLGEVTLSSPADPWAGRWPSSRASSSATW